MAHLLSEPIENLIQDQPCGAIKDDNGEVLKINVLIVGSGYGGAIAAMRLANGKKNRKVYVFERGKEYTKGDFPESLGDLPGHIQLLRNDRDLPIGYADALFDFRLDNPVSALVGCGLGGGSLINANVAMRPDEDLYKDAKWPTQLTKKVLDPIFDELEELFDVKTYDGVQKYTALGRLAKSVNAPCQPAKITITKDKPEGWVNKFGIPQDNCIGCGNCVTGCNYRAKNTLPTNALPLAKSRGAKLYTGVTVLSIEPASVPDGSEGWIVRFRRTATSKSVLHQEVFTLHAQAVILAAGTFGSTEILMRSQARGVVAFSSRLGERFSTNGDMLAFGYAQNKEVNALASVPQKRKVGPTITGYFTKEVGPDQTGNGIVRPKVTIEDGAVPSAVARVFGEVLATASVFKRNTKDDLPVWFENDPNRDPLAADPEALRHSQVLLVMGDDGSPYRLELKASEEGPPAHPDRMSIRIGAPPDKEPSLFAAVNSLLEKAEGQDGFDGGDYLPNPLWKVMPDTMSASGLVPGGHLLSVHPLGGCPMGEDHKSGVVDDHGQVFRSDGSRYEGLFVMDGAIIPCALGVNPFLTIAALAYHSAERVATQLDWDAAGIRRSPGGTWPERRADSKTTPSSPTSAASENFEIGEESKVIASSHATAVAANDPKVIVKFVESMMGKLSVKEVPPWVTRCFGNQAAAFNEKDRLILNVAIDIDVTRWLSNPNSEHNAEATLSVNRGPITPVHDDQLDKLATGQGRVMLLAWDRPSGDQQAQRQFAAIEAFLERRGNEVPWWVRLGWWLGFRNGPGKLIKGYLRVAKNHANWRYLKYRFKFDTNNGPVTLEGTKELAYAPGKRDPWTALTELPFTLQSAAGSVEGILSVDLVRLTRRAPFQVKESQDTPSTIMAMIKAGMMLFRVLFQTHFWSFGAPDYPKDSPIENRNPGPLRLIDGTTISPDLPSFFEVPVSTGSPELIRLRLLRYQPRKAENGSILIIHGLATSSLAFATDTIDVNMATYLCRNGYDVWLLDYRLSIALPYAARQCTMDQIAHSDMAAAIREVYKQTGPIQVFAHCIGAGSLAMAILDGKCHDSSYVNTDGTTGRSMISALVTHAVHPWMVPSVANHVKINLATFFQDSITQPTFDSVLPIDSVKTEFDVMLDRIAGSLPWPSRGDEQKDQTEQSFHVSETDERKGKEICNRLSLFYGFEWWHDNLSPETHKRIADLLGIVNLETVRQIYFILFRRRLTTRSGANAYVKKGNFDKFWTFPTLFAHGKDSQLYDPVSAMSSCLRLRSLRERAGLGNGPTYDVYWFEVPNCGHMDFLFGKDAATKVYPTLDAFFRQARRKPLPRDLRIAWNQIVNNQPTTDPYWEYDPQPECGPILGYARRDGNDIKLRVWVEPYLFSALDPPGNIAPGGQFSIVQVPLPKTTQYPPTDPDDPGTIPDYPGTYWVYDVSVPPEFNGDLRVSIDYSDPADITFKVEAVPTISYSDFKAALAQGLVEEMSITGRIIHGRLRPATSEEAGSVKLFRTIWEDDPDLKRDLQARRLLVTHMPGVIPLTRPWFKRLQSADTREQTAFLVGSCRYPGSPFDEDLADSIFKPMCEQVDDSNPQADDGVDHVLLVGDQIYADATADAFDVRELRERFAKRYREAFKASAMRRLLGSVPVYMALDDHEFGDNWPGDADDLPPADPLVQESRENFRHGRAAALAYQWSMSRRDGWPTNSVTGLPADEGELWYTFESNGLPFFVMDTRTQRTLRQARISHEEAELVGLNQFKALTKWLDEQHQGRNKDCPKFIVSGSLLTPVARQYVGPNDKSCLYRNNDGWAGYPATWRKLVKHIVSNPIQKPIQKVVFIAGDHHFSAVAKLTLSSGGRSVTAYQIVASGLFVPLPFANANPKDYDWDKTTALPFSDPASDSVGTRLEYVPLLLCQEMRHFVRVDATAQYIDVSAWGCDPWPLVPAGTVQAPFKFKPGSNTVIRLDL
jgi:cholesterol oxidase